MQIWDGLGGVPASSAGCVVTIGNFDGVHAGHRALLAKAAQRAAERGGLSVAMTFDPHPAFLHRPTQAPPQLTGHTDKLRLIGDAGIDAVLVVGYTEDFAAQSPEQFIRRYLVESLRAAEVVVGVDFRFGTGNAGDCDLLADLGARYGFDVVVVDDVHAPGQARRWSSTWARDLLEAGDVAGLAHVLGRPHFMRGAVVHGEARGRELGFPTANLDPASAGAVPADGIYAGWLVRADGTRHPAAISVGTNPTFDGVTRQVEAHVIGRDDLDLYGEEVVVEFIQLLRPMLRFDGVEALVTQMHADCREALAVLG